MTAVRAAPEPLVWPRWVGGVFVAVTVVVAGVTLAFVGISVTNLALAAVIVAVATLTCSHEGLRALDVLILVPACVALASNPGSPVLFLVCVACAEAALRASKRFALTLFGVAVVATAVRAVTVGHPFHPLDYFPWPLGYLCSAVGGLFAGTQVQLAASLRSQQEAVASEAALEERRRIAREIHDVIAHSMTVTMLHVSGARLALQDEPPDVGSALDALVEAERQGRQSLADVRRTVGLLAADAPGESQLDAPLPGAPDVPELVQSYAEAGQQIRCSIDGDLAHVPPATGLAVYRVVQESLANAAKHAPGAPVDLDVRVCGGLFGLGPVFGRVGRPAGRVDVQVRNGAGAGAPRPDEGGGRGISGMDERVRSLGGRLEAGPDGEGWRVCARLPIWQCEPLPTA